MSEDRNPGPTGATAETSGAARGRLLLRVAVGIAIVALLLVFGRRVAAYLPAFAHWVEGQGALGPLVFVLGYAAAVVAFVPGSVLTLAGGALFGVARGVVYVFIAAVLGSTLSFLLARHVARDAVARRIEGDARFAAIDRAIGEEGRRMVFLLRLSPVFPFNLLNYALGLTRVRLVDYVVASLGMLPGTILYVSVGKVGGDVVSAAGGAGGQRGPAEWALLGVGLAATVLVTLRITRIARRALDQATAGAQATTSP
ncbi:MAG: TVP38/TMEM64 family protein [Deltaproteobacteria bacterium]|nr:TVP38/TMEM64 family protein [Deltaproteobacteria bacterium]